MRLTCRWDLPFLAVLISLLALCVAFPVIASNQTDEAAIDTAIQALNVKRFRDKAQAVEDLLLLNFPRTRAILQAFLTNKLYYRKSDQRVIIIEQTDEGYNAHDAYSKLDYGQLQKNQIKKIKTNNKLRKMLRVSIAKLSLYHPDESVRQQAVREMLKDVSADDIDIFQKRLSTETSTDIKSDLKIGIALIEIESESSHHIKRMDAISTLSQSLLPIALAKLEALVAQEEDGTPIVKDAAIRNAAQRAINNIKSKTDFYNILETLFFGISLGSVLLLAAIGLAITFGVMGVINMAHGELIMIGAYTTYVVQLLMPNTIEWSLAVAIPAAFIVAGLFGILIERTVIRFLYGRPLETLLATFGISLILQQMVRSIFSPLNRSVETPSWMSGAWQINDALSLTFNRLYIIIFSLLVFITLLTTLKKTNLGLQVRAVSQNRSMAKALGIRSDWVDLLTFGLGSGIAGVAGVALSQLTNVGPNLGQAYIIDSFMVVVFGGVGNLWGTLVGALSLGVVNKFLEPWSGAVLAKIILLIFIILFIQKRPKGLFPQKGRAAGN
ncbi:MAG: urea ABC transporter permease subunit UrtB [Thiohalomonadales bacterium]